MAADQIDTCPEPDPADPSRVCGAVRAWATDRRCLAHLDRDARSAYLATLAPGADIDARGVTFTHDLLTELLNAFRDPQNRPQLGRAVFIGATFTEDAPFRSATFTGTAWFNGATFAGDAVFGGATFTGDAQFNAATFMEDAVFGGTTFTGDAWFNTVTFAGDALFRGTTFTRTARFDRATFTGSAGFDSSTFTRTARFGGTTFTMASEFMGATFTEDAWFNGVTFPLGALFQSSIVDGELVLEAIATKVVATNLRGQGRVNLRLRAAEVDLSDAVLAGPLNVHGLHHPIARTDETAFGDQTGHVPPVRVVSLRGLDASSVTLTDVDLSNCRFSGMHRVDQLVLDGQCTFAPGPGGRRRVLAEEHHWRAIQAAAQAESRPHLKGGRWTCGGDGEVVGPARLEVLYRQLRKATEDAKNEPGAADFYYGEMEMRRAAATRRPERWLLTLYWAISGYGLRARRALAWLALLAVVSVTGTTWFGFPHTGKDQQATGAVTTPAGQQPITLTVRRSELVNPLGDRVETATEVTLNAIIFRNPDADLTTAGRYLNITVRILGPILLGLTILAIRNQVKR